MQKLGGGAGYGGGGVWGGMQWWVSRGGGRGAGFGGGGGISFLIEAKQKGTVHRSAPQLLYIIFYRLLLRCRARLIV